VKNIELKEKEKKEDIKKDLYLIIKIMDL